MAILLISILNGVQTDPPIASDHSKDTLLDVSKTSNALGSDPAGNRNNDIASASGHPEIAWDALVGSGSDIAQFEALLEVAQTWIERDGIEVIDQISATLTDITVRDAVIASVLQKVASTNPQNALQQALELTGASRTFALQAIIKVWATSDPLAALASVPLVDSGSDGKTLQEEILRVWADVDSQELLDVVESLPADLRMLGLEVALIAISKERPVKAAQLMADLTDRELIDKLSKAIATHWSRRDAHAALEWVITNEYPTKEIKAEALMIVLVNLTREDPDLAFQTARDQPIVLSGQYYRGLEVVVIQQLVEHDIDAAAEMLAQVRNEGLTVAHAYLVVGQAYIRNGEFDRAFKLGERLSERGQQSYNGRLMYQWAFSEPEALFATIEGLPNDRMKEQAVRGLIRYNPDTNALSNQQLEQLAATYLPQE